MKTCFLFFAALLLLASPADSATQVDLPGPPGSGQFGFSVTVLPNGNFVVTDPSFDQVSPAIADIGAVYLYNPDGLLISTLRGSNANDQVGSGGITVLANGNFLVRIQNWNGNRGAVTWGSAVTGFIGGTSVTVSAANSLVGSTASDQVGLTGITALTNGHYVVRSANWDNTAPVAANAGAVTWGDGFNGTVGVVSAANSLVGTTAFDQVGRSGVTALTNGHYVVRSLNWDNGAAADAGAVTWGNGFTGTIGPVSDVNSLVGTTDSDNAGSSGITVLTNGHYVVTSPDWDNGPTADVGAATWGNGFDGTTTGPITPTNSLVGTTTSDQVGSGGGVALTNGHYVVRSPIWDNGPTSDAGAVTWGNGFTGITGPVTTSNSLHGTTANDNVGFAFARLTNGHYVVTSPDWDNGPTADVGAATWGNGFTGITGPVTPTNSLVGSTAVDLVGSGGVTALTNGHYVVRSANWDNGAATNAGAVTWGNGATGIKGPVTPANSLVGSTAVDLVGTGVRALTNGNYVVISANWDNGAATNAGAVTWGNGAVGIKGPVSPANSLVGSTAEDQVGNTGVTTLTNGHYVVGSRFWDNGPATDAGAATWGNGTTGIKGAITPANSLIGSTAGDLVGSGGVTALTNGHYVVGSANWTNDLITIAGAVTWGNGFTGITGPVTLANSLHGSTANDQTSVGGNSALRDGNALVRSSNWDNGSTSNAGAVSFIDGQTGTAGPITPANSVLGTVADGGSNLSFDYDPARKQMIVGRRDSNLVTLFRADRLRSLGLTNQPAPGAADIAFGKPGTAAVSPSGSALTDFTLTGSGSAKGQNRALFALNPVTGTDLVLQSGTPISSLGSGLPANATATTLLAPLCNQSHRALFQATAKGTGITAANNRLLLLDNGASVQLLHRTGTPIPALGGAAIASFKEVLQSHNQNFLALTYKLKTGGGVTPSNDEGLLFLDHSGSPGSNTLAAREGSPAFGGGTFGPFNGRAATAFGSTIYFTAALNIAGSTASAVFSTTLNGVTTAQLATTGDPAPASGGATFSTFPALTNAGVNALVKATLKNSPPSQNEGLYVLPTNLLLTRKGDDIGGGTFITRILRFWTAGPGQLILQVQLGKSQALLLRQNDGNYLTLLRTGTSAPGVSPAKLAVISAVEVNPVSGRYAVLGTLTGVPASSNQALWTGDPTLGDNTPANQILRLPQLTLSKGNAYSTEATPSGVIRSLALKPALDPTGAGGRGLAQALGASDDLALFITGDRNLVETVLLDR